MDAFWQAATQHNWMPTDYTPEFRVYHDDAGHVLFYSMEDVPGQYITVDRHTFEQFRLDVVVRDGKLVRLNHQASWRLMPSDSGTACHPDDITIIADSKAQNKQHWKVMTTHEAN